VVVGAFDALRRCGGHCPSWSAGAGVGAGPVRRSQEFSG
jgi:hypothetical protein